MHWRHYNMNLAAQDEYLTFLESEVFRVILLDQYFTS